MNWEYTLVFQRQHKHARLMIPGSEVDLKYGHGQGKFWERLITAILPHLRGWLLQPYKPWKVLGRPPRRVVRSSAGSVF